MIHFVFPTGEEIVAPVYPETKVLSLQNRVLHDGPYCLFFEGRELRPEQPIPEKILTEPESTIAVVPKSMLSQKDKKPLTGWGGRTGQDFLSDRSDHLSHRPRVECLSVFPLRNLLDYDVVPIRDNLARVDRHEDFFDDGYDDDTMDSYDDELVWGSDHHMYPEDYLDDFPMDFVGDRMWDDDIEEEEETSDPPREPTGLDVANLWSQLTPEETEQVQRLRAEHGTTDELTLQLYIVSNKKYEDADRLLREWH